MSRLIQDCANDKYPTQREAKEAIEYLNRTMPDRKFQLCGRAVGSWVMMQNGTTCFHCPPILLPECSKAQNGRSK